MTKTNWVDFPYIARSRSIATMDSRHSESMRNSYCCSLLTHSAWVGKWENEWVWVLSSSFLVSSNLLFPHRSANALCKHVEVPNTLDESCYCCRMSDVLEGSRRNVGNEKCEWNESKANKRRTQYVILHCFDIFQLFFCFHWKSHFK